MITKKDQIKLVSLKKKLFKKEDKNKFKVYLAGPMEYVKDHGVGWRTLIENKLIQSKKFTVFNPANKDKLNTEIKVFKELTKNTFQVEKIKAMFHYIIMDDLQEVLSSDLVLCRWFNGVFSAGTASELTFAKVFDIPVVTVVDDIENVPKWTLGCITHQQKSFRNIVEVCDRIIENKKYGIGVMSLDK